MQIKLLTYSDLHLKLKDSLGNATSDGLNTRVHRKLNSLGTVLELAEEHNVDYLVNLGDLHDSINPVDRIRNAYARVMSKYPHESILVGGNHETDGENTVGLDVSLLSNGGYVVVDKPMYMSGTSENVLLVPEVSEDEIVSILSNPEYKDCMILGHFGVEGATNISGFELPGVPLSLLSSRTWPTFLGHIHKRQIIGKDNVIFTGALCRDDFGDKDIPTGCCLITLEIGTSGLSDVRFEFIEVDDASFYQGNLAEGKEAELSFDVNLGDIVKLSYTGTREWFSSLDDYPIAPKKLVERYTNDGASKVIYTFNPVSNLEQVGVESISKAVNFVELIEEVATKDDVDSEKGKFYLERAQEKLYNG